MWEVRAEEGGVGWFFGGGENGSDGGDELRRV